MRNDGMKSIIYFAPFVYAVFCALGLGYAQIQSKDRLKLAEDAKREGKVVVYVSSNASDAKALKAAFRKKISICQYGVL